MRNQMERRILIVDDEPQALELIARYLTVELPELEIKTAADGRQAMQVALDWQPLVVMSDINMPQVTGLDLLDQLVKELPTTQVVLFTGREDLETPVVALRKGASDYLRKPLDMEELVITCERAVERALILRENEVYRESLEKAVAVRTVELEETNARLSQEIEGHRKTMAELLKAQEHYNLVQRAAHIGTWEWDVATDELTISTWLSEIYGKPADRRFKTRAEINELIYEKDRPGVAKAIDNCISHGKEYSVDFRIVKPDGSVRWISELGDALRDGSGRAFRILGVVQDTTERRTAEEERIRLYAAVEQVTELITMTDIEGRIVYVNKAFENITGYSQREVLGKTHAILKSGRHDEQFYSELWDTILAGKPWSAHLVNKRKNGELYDEEAAITPLRDPDGQIINFVAVKRDVTEERRMQQHLRQAQKMEAIGTLAGGIAHDFNNILFAIQGYSEMVAETLRDNEIGTEDIEEVMRATNRATDLVQQILTFSRQTEKQFVRVRLSSIVKEVLKLLRATLPSNIEINQQIKAATAHVMADPTQVHQILMNLCTNAWHAMADHGGEMNVSLRAIDLTETNKIEMIDLAEGEYLLLSVSDTGSGIPREIRDKIFEPFFTTKDFGEGTGMGLSVVHGIVTSMGGAITVYSELGRGTTFNVYLPRLATEAEEEETGKKPSIEGNERIMLVDDEKQLLEMLKRRLTRLGYRVTAFSHPRSALDEFTSRPDDYDLVITDMTLPYLTGDELSRLLLSIRPELPIIICTGFNHKLSREVAFEIGIKDYLDKPVTVDVLGTSIRRLLDGVDG